MASSTSTTPRPIFTTPKRIHRPPDNVQNTPKYATPRKLNKLTTPECFARVTVETPLAASKTRSSKERLDQESNLTVAVRVRPMNARELAVIGAADVVRVRDNELIVRSNPLGASATGLDHIFQYDYVFWSCDENSQLYTSQEDVFLALGKPLLNNAFRGYNACLFAYGQTGSGKSFSMMGKNNCETIDIDSEEYSGITPRFCRDLFSRIAKLSPDCTASVEVSYFEIYNEKIHDLLAVQNNGKTALKVREHPVWGPYVVDLTVHPVKNYKELRNWLLVGNKNRATAATTMNEKSSRSHSIFTIELCLSDGMKEGDSTRRSKVSLVDLAGSERLSTSHNTEEKIRQGVSINKSLLTLGKVISALAEQKKNNFVPYRESVLTWLLRESLGGNSLTSMLATITPANTHLEETLCTLRYACQARAIVNRARINENAHDRLIRELRLEVERLKALRQDYERTSISNLSLSELYNTQDEMDELKKKLSEAETRLVQAEQNWQQRFTENAEHQLRQLVESEKRREELESKVRILKTADTSIKLSPFKSNFLEELENILLGEHDIPFQSDEVVENVINWCGHHDMHCTYNSNVFTIIDKTKGRQTSLPLDKVTNIRDYDSFGNLLENLTWNDVMKIEKKLSKNEIVSNMSQIYQSLHRLKPNDSDTNLCLMFAKVNKSLQSFETALFNHLNKGGNTKTVTFNV